MKQPGQRKETGPQSRKPTKKKATRNRREHPPFQEVRRVTVAQSATEQIIAMISEGYYRPGDLLPTEAEFMEQLNIGRSSIREAMHSLALIGVVDRRPKRGTVVVSPIDDIPALQAKDAIAEWALRDLFDARAAVEGRAAYRAAEMATKSELARIEKLAAAVEKKIRAGQSTFNENGAFHRAIVEASHNKVLVHLFDVVNTAMRDVRQRFSTERDITEHSAIVDALKRSDAPRAQRLLEEHIRTVVAPGSEAD